MTPVVGTMGPELQYFIDQGMHRMAMKRFAQPEEIANGITYLSSWMSSFMSGEAMLWIFILICTLPWEVQTLMGR
ncbi:hypothetical protein ACHAPE_002595 [Trichoderma viride]